MWWTAIPAMMQMMQGQGGQGGQGAQGGGGQSGGMGGMLGSMGGGGNGGAQFGARMGGIANGLFNLFGAKNPSDAANPYLEGIQGQMGQYLNPYMDAGKRAMGTLEGQYNQNINDPTHMMNQIGAGFQHSPGYAAQVAAAEGAANRASAAGGMLGSPQQQQQIAGTVNQMANQDYYNYVDRGMGQYNMGLGGLGNINQMGYGAAGQMSQGALQQALAQAQNAYEGANTYNQQKGGGIGSIVGGLF